MINKRIIKKSTTLFLILSILFYLVPKTSYSQGPTAPEAASFESVDATDMVNLAMGDLTYVLPLLDVPSPEGGYPITLSYHAGIAIDQEASWTGLGWNINPGAINRSVSGAPDDWKESNFLSITYDEGGTISYHDFNVGVGWGEDGQYSVGLYGAYSENKAYSGENSYNFDYGVFAKVNGIKGHVGTDGIGLSYSGNKKLNIGTTIVNANFSIGINHSFKSGLSKFSFLADAKTSSTGTATGIKATSGSISVGLNVVNSIGGEGSSNSSNYSMRQMGMAVIGNVSAGLLQMNYQYRKMRYWLFDQTSKNVVGALYAKHYTEVDENTLYGLKSTIGFDTYKSFYDATDTGEMLKNNYSFIAYDSYSVSGQGIGGYISPKIFEYGSLNPKSRQLRYDGKNHAVFSTNKIGFNSQIGTENNIYFYFNNLFESYLEVKSDTWGSNPYEINEITDIEAPNSNKLTTATIDGVNYDNFNTINKRKVGSSFIESYTNLQIKNKPSLIIEATNFDRNNSNLPEDGIGGFKITVSDGKTYHYSLPVYQKEKFVRSTEYDKDINNAFYEEFQLKPYATHWMLTAITGSDYVDNGDAIVSEGDLGYWVSFDYGKWSDGYTWRTPSGTGLKTTISSKSYGWGVKEIYYLNSIKTRTHTALFVKSDRLDNKSKYKIFSKNYSSISRTSEKCYSPNNYQYYFHGLGIDIPTITVANSYSSSLTHRVKMSYEKYAHNSLKLDKIILLKNSDVPVNLKTYNSAQPSSSVKFSISIEEEISIYGNGEIFRHPFESIYNTTWNGEYYNNILDSQDISELAPTIENNAVKVIDFDYDYALASNSPNSNASNKGKLTLNKVNLRGKGGVQKTPPYSFEYINPAKKYDYSEVDDWGFIKNNVTAWNLNSIKQPTGANIKINYESDDYFKEAVPNSTVFNNGLKFSFSNVNDKLRILVENISDTNPNNINFTNFFQPNSTAKIDIWACVDHEYLSGFIIPTCHNRSGSVNIPNEEINVLSANIGSVVFETSLSYTSESNNGLAWLYSESNGPSYWSYKMGRLQDKPRGVCPNQSGNCDNTRYALKYVLNSNKILEDQDGGGIRVREITVEANGENYRTKYYYNQLEHDRDKNDSNYKSSGVTSYAPSVYSKNLKYITELPTPGVLYSNVTVENQNNEMTNYVFKTLGFYNETNFNIQLDDVFSMNLIQQSGDIDIDVPGSYTNILTKSKHEVVNNFSTLGKLLNMKRFNNKGQLIFETKNKYKSTSDIIQGVNQETFNTYTTARTWTDTDYLLEAFHLNISSKTSYPSVLESTTTTQGGYTNTTYFDKHDFNTGQLLETRTYASDGTAFKNKSVPAYTKYPEMGSKVDDITNKNMLSQQAASFTYLLDENDNIDKVVGAGITTWNNDWTYRDATGNEPLSSTEVPVWRKHKSFIWDGPIDSDGGYAGFDINNHDDRFWGDNNIPDISDPKSGLSYKPLKLRWKQVSEVTRYDHYSAPLENMDINNNFAATKMCDADSKVLAVSNAKYTEMYYSGAESVSSNSNYFDGEVKTSGSQSIIAHTGNYSEMSTSSRSVFEVNMKEGEHREGKYKVSVWVNNSNKNNARIFINGEIKEFNGEKMVAGVWTLMNHYEELSSNDETIYLTTSGGNVIYDDFRLYPVASSMSSYVYNEWDELWYIIGNNGLATMFEYDDAGRLVKTYSEVIDFNGIGTGGFKQVSSNNYNYKSQ